jgi:sialic acid synthase SpsE
MKNNFFKIGKKYVGKVNKVFIVAEIGINHEGSFNKCTKLFEEAKQSGADAVKLQTVDVEKNYVQGTASYNEFKNTDFTNEEFYKLSLVVKKDTSNFLATSDSL